MDEVEAVLVQDNTITEDKVTISEKFNTFFFNIGPNLVKGMLNQTIPPQSFMGEKISSTIFPEPVTNCEIQKIIMSLKMGLRDMTI